MYAVLFFNNNENYRLRYEYTCKPIWIFFFFFYKNMYFKFPKIQHKLLSTNILSKNKILVSPVLWFICHECMKYANEVRGFCLICLIFFFSSMKLGIIGNKQHVLHGFNIIRINIYFVMLINPFISNEKAVNEKPKKKKINKMIIKILIGLN